MTDILPPITDASIDRSIALTPTRRRNRRTLTVIDVVAVGLVTYLGAAALNSSDLQRIARRQPLGTHREIVVALTDEARQVSSRVGLDQPGRLIERIRGIADTTATTTPSRPIVRVLSETTTTSTSATPTTSPTTAVPTIAVPTIVTNGVPLDPHVPRPAGTPTEPVNPQIPRLAASTSTAVPATTTTAPGTTTTSGTTTTTPAPVPIVAPTAPIAYWYGGDSLSQGMGRSLERLAEADHGSTVSGKGVISTGLARPDVFDWSAAIGLAISQTKINVAVVLLGANDTQSVQSGDRTFEFGTPEWTKEYRDRIDALMTQADRGLVHLVWVGLPPVRQGSLEKQLRVIDEVFRSVAARHRNTVYLDLRRAFGSDDGGYDPYCHDDSSSQVLCRSNDGVHFTDTGYDRLAKLVMKTARSLTA